MGLIWEADLPQREKYVLLAYADHADHEGNNIFPSIGLIAWKTGYETRSIQRITKQLLIDGLLIPDGQSKYGTKRYSIAIDKLPKLPPYGRGVKLSGGIYGGDILSGDKLSGVTNGAERGDNLSQGGDIAVSPEPSLTSLTIINTPARPEIVVLKERTLQAVIKGTTQAEDIKQDIQSLLHINPNWRNKDWASLMVFLKGRPEGETITRFAEWWRETDWRGKQGQPPSAAQIRELWPQAFVVTEERQFRERY